MKKAALIIVLFGAVLAWRVVHYSGQVGTELLSGWLVYVERVAQKITWRWDAVAVFLLSLLAFAVLLHYLLRSLRPQPIDAQEAAAPRWRWRWTISIVGVTLLMFAGGISMIGAAHQTTWLLTSEDRLFVGVMQPWGSATSEAKLRNTTTSVALYSDNFQSYPSTNPHHPGVARHSWVTKILPYMGAYAEFDYKRPFNDPVNAPAFRRVVPLLINPELITDQIVDRDGFVLSHYAGNSRIFAASEPVHQDRVAKRAAQTILIGEVNADFAPWGDPDNCRNPAQGINTRGGFGGATSRGGAQFGMADGSVKFLADTIDPEVLRALSTPDAAVPQQ